MTLFGTAGGGWKANEYVFYFWPAFIGSVAAALIAITGWRTREIRASAVALAISLLIGFFVVKVSQSSKPSKDPDELGVNRDHERLPVFLAGSAAVTVACVLTSLGRFLFRFKPPAQGPSSTGPATPRPVSSLALVLATASFFLSCCPGIGALIGFSAMVVSTAPGRSPFGSVRLVPGCRSWSGSSGSCCWFSVVMSSFKTDGAHPS